MRWPFDDLIPLRYGAILADPPWQMAMWGENGRDRCPDAKSARNLQRRNRPERHYPTMSLDQIKALPVGHLAAPDCVLFLWAVDPMIPQAIEVGQAWGFTFKTIGFYWAKLRREGSTRHLLHDELDHKLFPMGTGYWTRANPEPCLLFTLGNPRRLSTAVRKLVIAPRREHSRKPEAVKARIEQLCDGPYCELFSRETRPGWASWGLDAGQFDELRQAAE